MKYNELNKSNYETQRYNVLLNVEETGVAQLQPYVDSKGIATIGIGFNLRVKDVLTSVLTGFGFNPQPSQIEIIKTIVDKEYAHATVSQIASSNIELRSALNAQMQRWNYSDFKFDNETQVRTAFDTIVENKEDDFDAFLHDRFYTVPNSNERFIVVRSLLTLV